MHNSEPVKQQLPAGTHAVTHGRGATYFAWRATTVSLVVWGMCVQEITNITSLLLNLRDFQPLELCHTALTITPWQIL